MPRKRRAQPRMLSITTGRDGVQVEQENESEHRRGQEALATHLEIEDLETRVRCAQSSGKARDGMGLTITLRPLA